MTGLNTPPTGDVTLSGAATQYETLSAVSTLADDDGLGPISWQWERRVGGAWSAIAGATDAAYTLAQADVGLAVRAVASYTDQLGTPETVASAPSAAVANVNDPPAGTVDIAGERALQGAPLSASASLSDPDGIGAVGFQWQRANLSGGWTAIGGATGAGYVPVQADVGRALRVVASYVDGQGTLEQVASDATPPIGNVNDAPTGALAVTGSLIQGQRLTAASTIADADGLGAVAYRWQRDEGVAGWRDIPDAGAVSYVTVQADVGRAVRAVASYTDLFGADESVVSAGAGPIANVNDAPTGAVLISGAPVQDQPLTVSDTLDDPDGIGDVAYVWQRSNGHGGWAGIAGASGGAYAPVQADVGFALRVVASYTDRYGAGELVISPATAAVANANDAPEGGVSVLGTPQQNEALTAVASLSDADGLGALAYTWQRYDGAGTWSTIPGATAFRYVAVQADVGRNLRAVATYTDGFGAVERVASDATAPVDNVNDPATGTITLAGALIQGQRLTATVAIADPDGLGAVVPRWQRLDALAGWLDIPGATGAGYTLGQDDVGHQLRVLAAFTDLLGSDENVASAATAVVANVNDPPTGAVTIGGIPLQGQALTASDTLDDLDGRGDVTYAWQRSSAGAWSAISGAFGPAYVPTAADAGHALRVVASYTDLQGTPESVASAGTAAVAGLSDLPAGAEAALALFDAAWYVATYPDVAAAGVNAFAHYMNYGWREGRDPSPLFHTAWYLNQNTDVAASGGNPLLHFALYGWREGRDPSIGFSLSRYGEAYPDVRAAGIDGLDHYMNYGQREGRVAFAATPRPNGPQDPLIDAAAYYARHPEAAAAGLDASAAYHAGGWRDGAAPSAWFDASYYLAQNPDIRAAGVDPLQHYESYGWREGRAPSLLFSPGAYLDTYADIRAANVEPLAHYVGYGRFEGRVAILPGGRAAADPLVDPAYYDRQLGATLIPTGVAAQQQAASSYDSVGWKNGLNPDPWFDTNYYLAHNPDVAAAHVDPLLHYESYGWREGRNPSGQFSVGGYLTANPDVRAAGVEPLAHYVAHGQFEGRSIVPV